MFMGRQEGSTGETEADGRRTTVGANVGRGLGSEVQSGGLASKWTGIGLFSQTGEKKVK